EDDPVCRGCSARSVGSEVSFGDQKVCSGNKRAGNGVVSKENHASSSSSSSSSSPYAASPGSGRTGGSVAAHHTDRVGANAYYLGGKDHDDSSTAATSSRVAASVPRSCSAPRTASTAPSAPG